MVVSKANDNRYLLNIPLTLYVAKYPQGGLKLVQLFIFYVAIKKVVYIITILVGV